MGAAVSVVEARSRQAVAREQLSVPCPGGTPVAQGKCVPRRRCGTSTAALYRARDVTNLAWKLKAVFREGAADALLETYAEERNRHVYTLTSRIKEIGRHICERDLQAARSRDASLLKQGG